VPGVVSAQSGYLGGTVPRPDYDRLSGGGTGHFEAVRVVYDPAIISHRALVDRFFRLVDPTDPGGQFCDRGESYRTAVWATDAAEARTIDAARAAAQAVLGASRPIVTPTLPPATFWPAETFHQDYARKNPVRYRFYRTTCGRDARLRELWGAAPH
jgi:peptide-methionine (S)-S-oxide reductase